MGRHTEAEQLVRQALEIDANYTPALTKLAEQAADRALAPRGDAKSLQEALALYERLASEGPLDEAALRKVANLKMLSGDVDGAIQATRQLAEMRPGDPQITQMLYRLLIHTNEEEEALSVLLTFVIKHPDELGLIEEADRLAAKNDAWERVARELGAGIDGQGPSAAQALLGEAYLRLGKMDAASRALEQALAADSGDRTTRFRLVLAYQGVGRLADAATLARNMTRDDPSDAFAHLVLARILDRQRDYDGALQSYSSALLLLNSGATDEDRRDRDVVRRSMVEVYMTRDQLSEAKRTIDALEEPQLTEALRLRSRLALLSEDWSEARDAARELRAQDDAGYAARVEGEVLLRTGKAAKAEARFDEAIEILGPQSRWIMARIYSDADRDTEGESLLRDWIDVEPKNADAHFELGRFLYLADRFDEAEVALTQAFTLNPVHAPALNFLGYSLAERKERLDEALTLIKRALAVDAWDGAYLDSLGWVYFQMGDYEAARVPLEQAVREYPHDPTILEHLGDLYARLGERELAVSAWAKALEADPEDEEGLRGKIDGADAIPDASEESAAVDGPRGADSPPIDR